MSRELHPEDIGDLCLGAAYFGAGGGGDVHFYRLIAERAIRRWGPVPLVRPEEIPEDALVVDVGESGSPIVGLEHLPPENHGVELLRRYERFLGRKVTHLIACELGGANSVVPLVVAAACRLPVIDGDGMGRAFPESQMMTFPIYGVAPTPAACTDFLGNVVYFETSDAHEYERETRALVTVMGGSLLAMDHPMTAAQVRETAVPGTLTLAQSVGRTLREHRGGADTLAPALAAHLHGTAYGAVVPLYTGKVERVSRRTEGGFDVGEVMLRAFEGAAPPLRIALRNEFLVAWLGDTVVATTPDLITMVEQESCQPITSERIRYGQRVSVIGIGAPRHYLTERGLRVVSPRNMGFDLDYRPLAQE
ncbi:MAG TPA: DUF917 domain-containing protein [Steroidobacteraceae bacterium]|jgi:hypothetical protein|nr:DUF917 domain-containing protein [Steroidobacteraceae bacterium]